MTGAGCGTAGPGAGVAGWAVFGGGGCGATIMGCGGGGGTGGSGGASARRIAGVTANSVAAAIRTTVQTVPISRLFNFMAWFLS